MKQKKPIQFAWTPETLLVLIAGLLLLFCVFKIVYDELDKQTSTITPANVTLSSILHYETARIDIPNGTCLDYATYFNKTLSENYKELDVRWIRYICLDDKTNCTLGHTSILVGGYRQLCLLNSNKYDCRNFVGSVG